MCEDQQSEFHHKRTTGQTFDIPRQLFSSTRTQKNPRGRSLVTHGDQILIPLLALGRARCLAHEDMDDTETVAMIGDGHAFGKKHGACLGSESFSSRSAGQRRLSPWRNTRTCTDVDRKPGVRIGHSPDQQVADEGHNPTVTMRCRRSHLNAS